MMAAGVVAAPDAAPADEACPTSFREFLARFTEEPAFQRRFTSEALAQSPPMPSRADQMALGLGVTIRRPAHGQALVRIASIEGRAHAVDYVFEENPDWTLVSREESSAN
ncbi:MAG: hypothetical protein ABI655_01585 [Phenylobacterium sp.]